MVIETDEAAAVIAAAKEYIDAKVNTIQKFIGGSLTGVGTAIQGIVTAIQTGVANTIKALVETFTAFTNTIITNITELISDVSDYVQGLINEVSDFINGALTKVGNFVTALTVSIGKEVSELFDSIVDSASIIADNVVESIGGLVTDAGDSIEIAYGYVADGITSITTSAVDKATEIYDDVSFFIGENLTTAGNYLGDLATGISNEVDSLITAGLDYVGGLYDTVNAGVETAIKNTSAIIKQFETGVDEFITAVIDVAGTRVTQLIETVADLPETIQNLTTELIESAKENIGEPIQGLANDLLVQITKSFGDISHDDQNKLQTIASRLASPGQLATGGIANIQKFIDENMPVHTVLKTVVNVMLVPFLLVSVMSGINQINAKNLMYDYAQETPHELLSPPDLVDALKRGSITPTQFSTDLKRLGYFPDDIGVLEKLGRQILPIDELIRFWLRGLINDDLLEKDLTGHGISHPDIVNLKQAAFFIPGPQDLITMAVREVFSPAIAERFGQFEDFPDDFKSWAAKQGINEEWARNYWAAHWSLPSPQMGFAMLHRDIIDEKDLTLLLKSLDIMPFWRDSLIKLSYNPLTRVDVRRMHKLGVLTYDEIIRAYKDIGYDETNATRLADFTVEYNKPKGQEDEAELKQLTRSNVTKMYKVGILDRETALALLLGLDYSPEAAELYLYEIDVAQELQQREDTSDLIIAEFKAGQITFEQAQDKIAQLGFESIETNLLINKLVLIQQSKHKLPTLDTLNKMVGAKIITDVDYLNTVSLLGYSDVWASRLLKLQTG